MRSFITYLLLSIILILSVSTEGQKVQLVKEIKVDSLKKEFRNILIGGFGQTATRIILDKLSERFIAKLKTQNINVAYYYLGPNVDSARENIKQLINNNYDAVLLFSPQDTSLLEVESGRGLDFFTLLLTGRVEIYNNTFLKYHQNFFIYLYSIESEKKLLWEALVSADGVLDDPGLSKKVFKTIYEALKKNAYLK